ncbi:hypothetical protein C6P45_000753 [Maudiozyma exigua]|uniref:HAT C-terminal dimerisation domain-containing protein n=1 Tax=Maudiozyma exigua TaxID=34358 RepID=A0A9P6W6N9_MAUEX|nr:hypothetical protein C6P45_000753 [Kazachstania exigua]
MEAINAEESNEFIRYMLERKIHQVPETIQEMGEGIYEFWISRRNEYPELSKLALNLLYMKRSTADIERSFSICKSILCHWYSLGSEMLAASILIRLGLDSFGIRPNKNTDEDLQETVLNYVSEHI